MDLKVLVLTHLNEVSLNKSKLKFRMETDYI